MKKQTWIKWLTGVAGALLFTGFVGYIDNSGSAHSDNSSLTASSTTVEQPREHREDFGSGFGRDQSAFSGDSDSGDSQSDGRIRTRAS